MYRKGTAFPSPGRSNSLWPSKADSAFRGPPATPIALSISFAASARPSPPMARLQCDLLRLWGPGAHGNHATFPELQAGRTALVEPKKAVVTTAFFRPKKVPNKKGR